MRWKGFVFVVMLSPFLGLVGLAWAIHLSDPLEEQYSQHVLPFYKIDPPWISMAVFADTSFNDPGNAADRTADIKLFFFDQDCQLRRNHLVKLTANDVEVLVLNDLSGLPDEGVIFADTNLFSDGGNERFLTYLILVNTADGTRVRLDSIPFDSRQQRAVHRRWLRYGAFNTIAATFGDDGPATTGIQTTLTFFNARGAGVVRSIGCEVGRPCIRPIGSRDTLREYMGRYGLPFGGDWVNTGPIQLEFYDGDENFLGSRRLDLRCFERDRLTGFIPSLTNELLGHVVASAFSGRGGRRLAFSGFEERVSTTGTMGIHSGYFRHSPSAGR
jgi:hypothetical protein